MSSLPGVSPLSCAVWVKVNQRQRLIRTGRTGHWLNHSKEHCLIGIKGNPEINRGLDGDVLLAEVCVCVCVCVALHSRLTVKRSNLDVLLWAGDG